MSVLGQCHWLPGNLFLYPLRLEELLLLARNGHMLVKDLVGSGARLPAFESQRHPP